MTEPTTVKEKPTKPLWMDYADLGAKIVLPIAVVSATLMFNASQAEIQTDRQESLRHAAERDGCLEFQFKLISLPSGTDPAVIDTLWEAIERKCDGAGEKPFAPTSRRVAAKTTDASVYSRARAALGETPTVPTTTPTGPPPVVEVAASATPNPRVYIQIHQEDQRSAAEALRTALRKSTLEGKPLVAPGVELPPNPRARVARTELRCAKDDCKAAPQLAAYISRLLNGQPIPVRDISRLYGDRSPRPGHYELWFGPDPIPIAASTSGAAPTP